jgi:hypothetical protein
LGGAGQHAHRVSTRGLPTISSLRMISLSAQNQRRSHNGVACSCRRSALSIHSSINHNRAGARHERPVFGIAHTPVLSTLRYWPDQLPRSTKGQVTRPCDGPVCVIIKIGQGLSFRVLVFVKSQPLQKQLLECREKLEHGSRRVSAKFSRSCRRVEPPADADAGTSAFPRTPTSWGLWLRRAICRGKCASLQTWLMCLPPPQHPFSLHSSTAITIINVARPRSKQQMRSLGRSCRLLWKVLCLLFNDHRQQVMPALFDHCCVTHGIMTNGQAHQPVTSAGRSVRACAFVLLSARCRCHSARKSSRYIQCWPNAQYHLLRVTVDRST